MSLAISVMTFNMANYDDHGNWATRVNLFASIISQTGPDVVLFQEVRFNPDQANTKTTYQNMAEQVLMVLQKQNFYRGAYHTHEAVERIPLYPEDRGFNVPSPASLSSLQTTQLWEGLSIISKYWIKETGSLWLTLPNKFSGDRNTRATQYAAIDLSNGSARQNLFFVFNTHFSYTQEDAIDNIQQTKDYIKRFDGLSKGNYLLAGDFNMEPGSAPINLLDSDPYFVDLWTRLRGSELGYTFPSTGPIKRIDYIYTSPSLATKATNIKIVGNSAVSGVYASDHVGLIAYFSIPMSFQQEPQQIQTQEEEDDLMKSFVLVQSQQ